MLVDPHIAITSSTPGSVSTIVYKETCQDSAVVDRKVIISLITGMRFCPTIVVAGLG